MTDVKTCNLELEQAKSGWKLYLQVPDAKGKPQRVGVQKGWLSAELKQVFSEAPEQLRGRAVEYRLIDGKPQQVWVAGKAWDGAAAPTPAPAQSAARPTAGEGQTAGPAFENPYNFIPAPPRKPDHPDLGDAPPVGHHRWHGGRWSGRIRVELTTVTPLLIPDLGRPLHADHKVYGVRVDEQGVPSLPPTSLKGPLRAAYEAMTNSRMGVLEQHDARLALRMDARDGVKLVPCRIVANDEGALSAELLPGQSKIGPDGKPAGQGRNCLMYAAWLARYRAYGRSTNNIRADKHEPQSATRYSDANHLPQHGDHVFVQLERQVHNSERFAYLRVTGIRPAEPGLTCPAGWYEGWVFVSGPNIMNKHDERVFLLTPAARQLPLSMDLIQGWTRLIHDYQEVHQTELADRRRHDPPQQPQAYLGHEPGQTGFSRHVFTAGYERLTAGTLCYAEVETDNQGNPKRIKNLFPVSISRLLYLETPISRLAGTNLTSAAHLAALSPADRVFGWVNGNGHGSHKGQLRIGPVTCLDGAHAVERLGGEDGKPLAILGQPKPAQARFYAARNQQGDPMVKGAKKTDGYAPNTGLRGRKVYPHQRQAEALDYWDATTDRAGPTATGLAGRPIHREWQHHDYSRDSQNRSITAWVKAETRFAFDLDVINLSPVELGALLWLLSLPPDHYLRIGGGKPLGFGSVRLAITGLALRDGEAIRADYAAFDQPAMAGARITTFAEAVPLIDAWRAALPAALGKPKIAFEDLELIKAFCNAARGGTLPVHYPRTAKQRSPAGETYKWFVANEKEGARHPLPALWRDDDQRGLPALGSVDS